ncbi:NADH:flavin oxidoreductase [Methylobacterium aquaticum]|uniref:NADH:flavin oxidoreductase n=1 Tax=Methylobacterium aquaticum TaxID=270351 RepID=UPI003D164CAF
MQAPEGWHDPAIGSLLAPGALGGLRLRNRLAVAPMTRVSAEADGRPTPRMAEYYAAFARGGFGLVITEGIYTDKAYAQGYRHQPGLTDAAQRDGWRSIVDGVQAHGARIVAQLMHAGALSQGNAFRAGTKGPSAVRPKGEQMPFYRGSGAYPLPEAMTTADIVAAVDGFAAAAALARDAGFDGIEIHAANGYLLDQFLSEGINRRDDRYGRDAAGRLLLTVEVVEAVRKVVGRDVPIGIRISQGKVNDPAHTWRGEAEAAFIFGRLGSLAVDYLHTTAHEAWQPAFDAGPSLAALAKRHGGKPVLANGSLHVPGQAAALLERGEADLVSLGRGALVHADWPRRLAGGLPLLEFDRGLLSPIADLANADRVRAERCRGEV